MSTQKLFPLDILDWWLEVQPCVKTFNEIIELSPVTDAEKAKRIAAEISDLYHALQQHICPEEFNEAYNHLIRAVINLHMCHNANAGWDESRTYLHAAILCWNDAKRAFRDRGILGL